MAYGKASFHYSPHSMGLVYLPMGLVYLPTFSWFCGKLTQIRLWVVEWNVAICFSSCGENESVGVKKKQCRGSWNQHFFLWGDVGNFNFQTSPHSKRGHYMTPTQTMHYYRGNPPKSAYICIVIALFDRWTLFKWNTFFPVWCLMFLSGVWDTLAGWIWGRHKTSTINKRATVLNICISTNVRIG